MAPALNAAAPAAITDMLSHPVQYSRARAKPKKPRPAKSAPATSVPRAPHISAASPARKIKGINKTCVADSQRAIRSFGIPNISDKFSLMLPRTAITIPNPKALALAAGAKSGNAVMADFLPEDPRRCSPSNTITEKRSPHLDGRQIARTLGLGRESD